MENQNGQIPAEILPENTPAGGQDSPPAKRAPGLLVPVILILIGIGLWFILFEVPRRAALSEFRAASAAYEETYQTYYNAVDAVNRKVLAWQKEIPTLESSCATLKQLLTTGEPLRTKDADDAKALLKEAEKVKENMPLSEPVITTLYLYAAFNPFPPYTARKVDPFSWGRTPFVVAKSLDDGRSWSAPVVVEDDPHRGYCYPSFFFTRDGALLLSYCRGGHECANCLCRLGIMKIGLDEIA